MDGTFMRIEKPCNWDDAYYCYKKHMAIILFVRVSMRVAGSRILVLEGQVGDAHI